MRTRALHGLAILAAALALLASSLHAEARAGSDSARVEPVAFVLGRAVAEWRAGNARGVIENLEPIDFASASGIAEADRAAFLLGQAYLNLGDIARFVTLARTVADWKLATTYTNWLAFQLDRAEAAQAPALAEAQWARLAADTTSALARDLAGAARVRRAQQALARGEDPRALLAAVPPGSRYAARARHIMAMAALERGDAEAGERILETLRADSTYAGRREVGLALAGLALDRASWSIALESYERIDRDWTRDREVLMRTLASGSFDEVWASWDLDAAVADALVLDARLVKGSADVLARGSLDLTLRPKLNVPTLDVAPSSAGARSPIPMPSAQEWAAVAEAARNADQAAARLTRTRWELDAERERLDAMRRYLGTGQEATRREAAELLRRTALLDSLRRTLAALDARLRSVRDAATRRVLERAASVVQQCANDVLWIQGMRRFHLEGPQGSVPGAAAPTMAAADSVLRAEEALARAILAAARSLAAGAPDLIARSYERAWRPGLIDRAHRQADEAARALAWTRMLAGAIDSSIAAHATSPALRALATRVTRLEYSADSLLARHEALRAEVAHTAVTRALDQLTAEREAIDYGLAAAAYGLGVRLSPATASTTVPVMLARGADDDSTAATEGNDSNDPWLARWRGEAIVQTRAFLDRHPRSFARGEMRFRLADLLLVEARHAFDQRMAEYVRAQSEHRPAGPLPVLSHAEPLALYRAILAEDAAFEHRDAAMFNAATILADQGAPAEAERLLADLVREHPHSDYVQESHLRMGDMRFAAKQYVDAIALYEKAASGPEAGLTAIALYKSGWAHYLENRYREAADAFRAVLDLYGAEPSIAKQADLADEAEAYLVHALAGAGGARAFAAYFDRIGARPYEARVLLALGENLRRLGLHADAGASDELFATRYPRHPDALLGAQRMIASRRRTSPRAAVTQARLDYAPRFAPGSAWFNAQASDSLRNAGSEFARASWTAAAREHHRTARTRGARGDWRTALATYEILLERWPHDSENETLALAAGEAAAALGNHEQSLRLYGIAAASKRDSVAQAGLWQRVAVADAWYCGAAPGSKPAMADGSAARGSDALAKAAQPAMSPASDSVGRIVLGAADALLERYPRHPRAAEMVWRTGNLAFAHGWFERAAQDFDRFVTRHGEDRRAPQAAGLRADALYRLGDFEAAAGAYEVAFATAHSAGADSLARRAAQAIPICHYRHAEAAVAADSTQYGAHAARFETIARRWPGYEHAHLAQYRAGLALLAARRTNDAVRAMNAVITNFPASSYVRDAHLHIAQALKEAGESERAAEAYARFAARYPDDPNGRDAWLEAADLFAAAGLTARADEHRLAYLTVFPDDREAALEILEPFARRDLDAVSDSRPLATMLVAPRAARGAAIASGTYLAQYMKRAAADPAFASPALLARVRFMEAEVSFAAGSRIRLALPLAKSIPARVKALDRTLSLYRRTVDLGVPEWSHAAAFRIGEALVGFAEALERSERPADLKGDDLAAYEEVLATKSRPYHDRGEGVWTDLLRQQVREAPRDAWVEKAELALWQRLGTRFFFRPETDYPLVAATPPAHEPDPTIAPADGASPTPRGDAAREDRK